MTESEMCRLLESGKHVITPCPYWFPFVQNPEVAATLKKACSGVAPRFISLRMTPSEL